MGSRKGRGKPLSTESLRKGALYVRGCFALLFLIPPLPKQPPQGKVKEAFKRRDLVQREENVVPFALTHLFYIIICVPIKTI